MHATRWSRSSSFPPLPRDPQEGVHGRALTQRCVGALLAFAALIGLSAGEPFRQPRLSPKARRLLAAADRTLRAPQTVRPRRAGDRNAARGHLQQEGHGEAPTRAHITQEQRHEAAAFRISEGVTPRDGGLHLACSLRELVRWQEEHRISHADADLFDANLKGAMWTDNGECAPRPLGRCEQWLSWWRVVRCCRGAVETGLRRHRR